MDDNAFSAPRPGRVWKNRADFFRPFRAIAGEAGQNIAPLHDPSLPLIPLNEPDLRELNNALAALADVFPDVQPEVFREMLTSLSYESRLQVVTEQMLHQNAKWVRGRWVTRRKDEAQPKLQRGMIVGLDPHVHTCLRPDDFFRSNGYKKATKQVLYQEFRNLSHSTIKAVLAEQNFSYSSSRPILQELSARSWRFSLSNIWSKRTPTSETHPSIVERWNYGQAEPGVKRTGDDELDRELYDLFVAPIVAQRARERMRSDHALASELNEQQATEAGALFECECCYSAVPFENIAVCDDGEHLLCLRCIRQTVNESLYGQGWARNTDLKMSTIRCFASTSQACHGSIDRDSLRRALDEELSSQDHWQAFESRLTSETLLQSGIKLQKCPFCSYAEVDELPLLNMWDMIAPWIDTATWSNGTTRIALVLFVAVVTSPVLPFLLLTVLLGYVFPMRPTVASLLKQSWARVYRRRRGLKFRCQYPTCRAVSCMRCSAAWSDPHVCFDSEQTSLRIAIEASATAAIKRTCPKCMLSFVKSSGCNKLVCNCGYIMCYVCRQEITSREGYAHFCQHFRPNGGRCSECERCDLYGDEDEDVAIREAAKAAEKAWREKEDGGQCDDAANQAVMDAFIGHANEERWYERWIDVVVDALVV